MVKLILGEGAFWQTAVVPEIDAFTRTGTLTILEAWLLKHPTVVVVIKVTV